MSPLLTYFAISISATMAGLMFYMAVGNLDESVISDGKTKYIILGIGLSALCTPFGAWLISAIMKMKKLPPLSSL